MEPISVQRHSDVLDCLLNMCHLEAMVPHVDGLFSRFPLCEKTWWTQGVQAAWSLGRWDLMDEYLGGADEDGLLCSSSESNALFVLDVEKILRAMMEKDQFSVAEKIALSKQALIAPLAAAGMDSYARAYPFIVKLHLLWELEDSNSLLNENRFWHFEDLFRAGGLDPQVGNCWIQYAKLCWSAGHYEVARSANLEAKAAGTSNKQADGAIAELQHSLLNMPLGIVGSAAISSITSLSVVPLNPPPPLLVDTRSMNKIEDVVKCLLMLESTRRTMQNSLREGGHPIQLDYFCRTC